MSGSVPGLTDGSGEFETYPWDHPMCQHEDAWYINDSMCGIRDQVRTVMNIWIGDQLTVTTTVERRLAVICGPTSTATTCSCS